MKKITLIVLIALSIKSFAQSDEGSNLYVSAGVQAGFYALTKGYKSVPYHIHIDKLLPKRNVIGLGYSYDAYNSIPDYLLFSGGSDTRHNFRVRYYRYFKDENLRVSAYMGCSVGVSVWEREAKRVPIYDYSNGYYGNYTQIGYTLQPKSYTYSPSAQFIFGFKVKINEALFWQTEVSYGSPYQIQTSLGIKF